jgi:hypothetical protein
MKPGGSGVGRQATAVEVLRQVYGNWTLRSVARVTPWKGAIVPGR